jgi:hypothetical protein
MLQPGHAPEFIFTLAQPGSEPGKTGFFVMSSSAGPVSLLFTTVYRARDYLEHTGIKEFCILRLQLDPLVRMSNALSSGGFKSYAIDFCPRCTELQLWPVGNLTSQRIFFFSLALVVSLRGLEAEILVRELIRTADTQKRVSLLKQLVEHVDPSNPTAYHFLAFTAQETDKSLADWALKRIKAFWPDYVAQIEPPPDQNGGVEKWTEQVAKLTLGLGIQYGVLKIPQKTGNS